MQLTICRADLLNPAHAAALISVLDSYASDPIGGGVPLAPEVRERLVPALREHPTTLVLLAFMGEEPVGLAICFLGFSSFRAAPLLNVHDLAVVPERREKGIGRALLQEAEKQAVARGCCKLTLEVQDDNARARHLYSSFGFEDFVLGGDSVPTRFLSKSLS